MKTVQLPAVFGRYRAALDGVMQEIMGQADPPLLYRMMRYQMGWEDAEGHAQTNGGGKALRPTMCLLACEAVGGKWQKALPAAAALELVHNFSLIHDDIQDQDRERRHQPTVWALWGQPQAINAGDSMVTLAHVAVLSLADTGIEPMKVVEATRALDEACLEMIEGQCLDLDFEGSLDIGLDAYLEMIAKKTGALFGCSLYLGGLIGSDDPQVAQALRRCGHLLGSAFQVRDDMLGVWGAGTGKPVGADIRRRKKSLPIVYALSRAEGATRSQLIELYRKPTVDDQGVAIVLKTLQEVGAAEYCLEMAASKKADALAALTPLGLGGTAFQELQELAEFLLDRDY